MEKLLKVNPVIIEMESNWEKYGFFNKEEVRTYSACIVMKSLRDNGGIDNFQENSGFRNAKTPEELLMRYPLDSIRKFNSSLNEK